MSRNPVVCELSVFVIASLLVIGPFGQEAAEALVDLPPEREPAAAPSEAEDRPGRGRYDEKTFLIKIKEARGGQDVLLRCLHCADPLGRRLAHAIAHPDGRRLEVLNARFGIRRVSTLLTRWHDADPSVARERRVRHLLGHRTAGAGGGAPADLPDLTRLYLVEREVPADGAATVPTIDELCAAYRALEIVEYCQPNHAIQPAWVPDDPSYHSSGTLGPFDDLWGLKRMEVERAWNVTRGRSANGEPVVVAVVDTGVDYTHPDLAENIWVNPDDPPGDVPDGCDRVAMPGIDPADDDCNQLVDDVRGWDFGSNDNDPRDPIGHGTHVAGTIAAVANNSLGIVGVAPEVQILSVKAFDDNGGAFEATLFDGVEYAAAEGALVINASWGCVYPCPENPAGEEMVRTLSRANRVIVFAAGNSNNTVDLYSPENLPESLTVAAVDHRDRKSDFSNYGNAIDVAAPGGESPTGPPAWGFDVRTASILSLRAPGTDLFLGRRGYAAGDAFLPRGDPAANLTRAAGTSMAAPHVAGLSALILARFGPMTSAAVAARLAGTADPIDDLNPAYRGLLGAGRVNAGRALTEPAHPALRVLRLDVRDPQGNGNQLAEPGEQVELVITVKNYWQAAADIVGRISSADPSLAMVRDSAAFGALGTDAIGDNKDAPFVVVVPQDSPPGTRLALRLDLDAEGGYRTSESVALTVVRPTEPEDAGWPQIRHNAQRAGRNPTAELTLPLQGIWQAQAGHLFNAAGAVPVVLQDSLYISESVWHSPGAYTLLYALDTETGSLRWTYPTVGQSHEASATFLDREGKPNVVVGDRLPFDGYLYCLRDEPDAPVVKWVYDLGAPNNTGATVAGPVVYAVGGGRTLHAVDRETGRRLWTFDTRPGWDPREFGRVFAEPAVNPATGDVFISDGGLYCIRPDGTLRWQYRRFLSSDLSGPAVADDLVIVGLGGPQNGIDYLYAFDALTGREVWQFSTGEVIRASPLVAGGTTYLCNPRNIWAVGLQTGTLRWRFPTPRGSFTPCAMAADGTLFAATQAGLLFGLDGETGGEIWRTVLPDDRFGEQTTSTTPLALTRDALYVPTHEGTILKYQSPQPPDDSVTTLEIPAASDNEIRSGEPETVFSAQETISVGYEPDGRGATRSFAHFNLSAIPEGAYVLSAVVRASPTSLGSSNGSTNDVLMRPLAAWDPATLTWQTAPTLDAAFQSRAVPARFHPWGSFFRTIEFDVTPLVRGWVNGTILNTGIALRNSDESAIGSRSYWSLEHRWGLEEVDRSSERWLQLVVRFLRADHGSIFLRGDANADGLHDVSDAVTVLLHLFRDLPIASRDAADANDDGQLDVSDAVFVANFLFLGGTEFPPPYPEPGPDPTQDTLTR